ncbi:IS66 family insertion sequence element accessory protein TnpB [Acidiferrobacter sp.]|uniref:IS66 family insertion sequence element accessory protein TnpB n=1 Tax=Acidiferrobacter sp. TaxID=1872107 RepID=UPI002615D736|nr:IS66 family insertion sequence element accessory protein TnpB [Acidiferrobacter sp.]
MIAITPQMRVLVAIEPVDFRVGIDGLAQRCRAVLHEDPFQGTVFVFRSRSHTAIKLLVYDGQGYWLCHKRLSQGRFRYWPQASDGVVSAVLAHEVQVLLSAGDPTQSHAPPHWRPVGGSRGPRAPAAVLRGGDGAGLGERACVP